MRHRLALCVLLAAFQATSAGADEGSLTPDAFLDIVAGRTATFVLRGTGELVGEERFLDRRRTIWARADGTCALGEIRRRGDKLCFAYDDGPGREHCWLVFKEDGDPMVRSTINGEVQRVAGLSKRHVGCTGEPLS